MLFEKYQDCFLVLGYPKIRINGFFMLSLHVACYLLKRTNGFKEEIV